MVNISTHLLSLYLHPALGRSANCLYIDDILISSNFKITASTTSTFIYAGSSLEKQMYDLANTNRTITIK